MTQKIVIEVGLDCEKCRRKALKIAAVSNGVSSVALEGKERDQVVVTGVGMDSFCLVKALRKKFSHAKILTVEEVKDKKDKKEKEEKEEETKPLPYYYCTPYHPSYFSYPVYHEGPSTCIIM